MISASHIKSVIILILISVSASAFGAVREFDRVEFGSLKFITRADIAAGSGMARNGVKIVVDIPRLDAWLSKESMVKSYKLIDKNSVLTILVCEYEPAFTVVLKGKNRTVLCEADRGGKIVSAGRVYKHDSPVIIASLDEMKGNTLPPGVLSLIGFLADDKNKRIRSELGQITLRQDGQYDLIFRGRPTVFTSGSDEGSFLRLEAVTGQLDREGKYPKTAVIHENFVVVYSAD
jgi:hypothetical protein